MTILRPASRSARVLFVSLVALASLPTACLPPVSREPAQSGAAASGAVRPIASASSAPTGPTLRPSFVPPTPTPAPTFAVHTVAAGDSLTSIATTYRTSARSIAFWNRATYPSLDPESPAYRPNLLKLGWTLFLIPNVILTDDEAPALPTSEPSSG
ncbi:MAG TPA: LysM domain-containing protein [Patescibacteria group bacterium]|nr:LysM domain-containing protein [Patescibacteria group bacterium]